MPYGKTKVYFDGSHYIAIPQRKRFIKKRIKSVEKIKLDAEEGTVSKTKSAISFIEAVPVSHVKNSENNLIKNNKSYHENLLFKKSNLKEIFEKLFKENKSENRSNCKKFIINSMKEYFKDELDAEEYVNVQIQRKSRNIIARRIRCIRKANLQAFNYFVTFTYDSKKHTEESFKSKLKTCLKNLVNRKNWRYLGVWERSPEKNRLHFHGLFYIPENTMPGIMIEVKDYSSIAQKMQITHQNVYFNELFGRSDFEKIIDKAQYMESVNYILKYIEKSEDKIVYSKGLPQYFISDIVDEDVVCTFGIEDKKLLLFDDFKCWDEGALVGRVSDETIAQLRKSN